MEIVIDFDAVPVHQVRNFGEDLFRAFNDNRAVSVSLAEVDRATDQLRLVVRYSSMRRLRSAVRTIELLLDEKLLATRTHLSQVDNPS